MLLGAVVPEMRSEAEALAGELADLVRVRAEAAAERDGLAARSRRAVEGEAAHDAAGRRAAEAPGRGSKRSSKQSASAPPQLSRQADNLKDLIARLEQRPRQRDARGAYCQEGRALGDTRADLSALKDPGRLGPAIAFASAKGMLPIPGQRGTNRAISALRTGLGGTEKGVSITTRPGAQVTAPCDGWVVYAAPIRSYGNS